MHILKILDILEKLEAKLAELYEWYASIFSADAEAAGLFNRLSIDESAHVNLVRYLRRVVSQNLKLIGEMSLDTDSVEAMLAKVESLRSGTKPSLQEAVKASMDLESSASEAHYIPSLEQTTPIVGQILSNLGNFDFKHWGIIEEFAASREFPFGSRRKPPSAAQSVSHMGDKKIHDENIPMPAQILEKVEYYHEWHNTMDFYKILGVPDYASSDDIRKAFRTLAHELHPDRYMSAPKDQMIKLTAVFAYITEAYVTLINTDKRREYDKTLGARPRR